MWHVTIRMPLQTCRIRAVCQGTVDGIRRRSFLFVGRNGPFAFAAGEVEAAARKAALYLPSHLAYHFAGHFVIQLRHSAGVPAGCGTAEECTAAFAFQCGDVARVYGAYHDFRSPGRFHGEFRHQCVQALSALRALFVRGKAIGIVMRLGFRLGFMLFLLYLSLSFSFYISDTFRFSYPFSIIPDSMRPDLMPSRRAEKKSSCCR